MTTRIVLIRHGESYNNVDGRVGGPKGCTGLSPEGVEQVERLSKRLANDHATFDVFLCSTLPRAQETAEILSDVVGFEPIALDELCEFVPGECDGEDWAPWDEKFQSMISTERDEPLSPGGESINQFRDRVESTLLKLAKDYTDQRVLVVTHGGFVYGSIERMLGEDPSFEVENTSINEWEVENNHWRLVRFNDHAHLL